MPKKYYVQNQHNSLHFSLDFLSFLAVSVSSSSSAVILPIFLLLAFNPQNVPNRINIKLAVSKNKEIPKIQKISGFLLDSNHCFFLNTVLEKQ